MVTPQRDYDIYKDSPLRLLGYANECGEALRGFIGKRMVYVSYGIAHLYVFADTIDKTGKTYKRHQGTPQCSKKTVFAATDTLVWQLLASVYIPGYTINRVCALTNFLVKNIKLAGSTRKTIVTSVGLIVIPFIITPIDRFTDLLLDFSLRKVAK